MPEMRTDLFVVTDLETTGLDDKQDFVLEIGVVIADKSLNVVNAKNWLCRPDGWLERLKMNETVYEMHKKSGLLDELMTLPDRRPRDDNQNVGWGEPQGALLVWQWLVDELHLEAGAYPMVGSSVHFDRRFAGNRLHVMEAFFHYRNIDVSSVRTLCSAFNPEVYEALKSLPQFKKENAAHRAVADACTTLAELRFLRENFLRDQEFNDLVEYVGDKGMPI